ncbi:GumC family protein [Thermomonas hydrothermalis]|uniref:non-specific protein-tyrosine kinase n=1 Tax=Thermomonas hydrothermalis TaxID=213588 RepID=A0A1M5AK75_9GAMM|nr:polysaccharide biosynthesis tyrosine autokinase [Thermomonas hydrothermalis]MCL6618315.1 polysaccharide biosynthesis tyrosine autokinase [Thermomonas hydrothermalis]SHF30661.1 capsular exopolysaccharide family [Thermomonas hydrothermalis]
MTDERLPAGPSGDDARLPARSEPQAAALAQLRPSAMLALELQNDQQRDEDEIDLRALWHVLVKRRRLIVGVLVAVVALALLVTLTATPIYRASTVLQLEKSGIQVVQVNGIQPGEESGYDPTFLQTQYELIKSRALAERVANELNVDRATLERLQDEGWLGRMLALLNPKAKKKTAGLVPSNAGQGAFDDLRDAADFIGKHLDVEPIRNSRLVRVNFDSPSPEFSARTANAIAEGFIAASLERRFGASSYAKTYLEEQLKLTKAKLEESERKLVEFAQKENLVNTGEQGQSLAAQNLVQLNNALAQAQEQRIRAQSRWQQALNGAMPPDMIANSNIRALQQQKGQLQAQYQLKLQTFKPEYPEMLQLKSQIDELDRQIAKETDAVRASVKAEYDAAVRQEQMLSQQIAALRAQALDVDGRSIQYNILKREVDTNRQLYDGLLQRYKEVGVAGDVRANNISIIDRAEVPDKRYKPNLVLNLAIGLLLGGVLGVLLAFLLEFLDDTLKTPDDIEQKLKLPVLGVIPKLGPKENVADAAANPQSSFSEAYRSVRTALQFATDHGVPRTLLVTSSGPGEGKSTTALALARNLVQLGKRVLLVDADLRNPSLHKTLRLRPAVGLSNLLAGACTFSEAVQASGEERLDVILAGPLPPNPAELLAGSKLVSLLTVACERYDHVIVDGPPVLGLADAPILGNAVDGTLLVVHSAKTKISAGQSALKRLLVARARIVGCLLTKYDARTAGYGYGYGYHYESYYAYGGKPRLTKG